MPVCRDHLIRRSARRICGFRTPKEPSTYPIWHPRHWSNFRKWFAAASHDERVTEANAMVLATADADAVPSTRTVLLKGVDERGFVFFSNLTSRKSRELHANPNASVTFPWFAQHRQVVVCGRAEEIPREETLEYFTSRPHESQLGAWASNQSTPIESRRVLDEQWTALHEIPSGQ